MTRDNKLLHKLLILSLGVAGIYIYLWSAMDVPQMRHDRLRAFMWGPGFLRGHITYCGGLAEYLHAFLLQLYTYPWVGTAVLTTVFGTLYLVARGLLASYTDRPSRFIPLLPAVLGLVLVNSRMTLVPILGMIAAVSAAWLCVRMRTRSTIARQLLFAGTALALYYAVAGGFLLFVMLCVLHELTRRRWWAAGVSLLLGSVIPIVARLWIYEPDLIALYFRNAPIETKTKQLNSVTILLYACACLSFPAGVLGARLSREEPTPGENRTPTLKRKVALLVFTAVIAGLLTIPIIARARHNHWTVAERLIAAEQWEEALTCIQSLNTTDLQTSHMANRALFHSGCLLDDMFQYPQYSPAALFLEGKEADALPRAFDKRSRIYLDLGMMSRAERWTLEAMTIMGELPSLAKRMVTINVVKGRPTVAAAYLGVLKKTPYQLEWAKNYEARLKNDPLMQQDPRICSLRESMLKVNYADTLTAEELLGLCLSQNPENKMAFEYLMAYYLLARRPDKLHKYAALLTQKGYNRMPRHWEEAILSHARKTGSPPATAASLLVTPETSARFRAFMSTATRYMSGKKELFADLKKDFGDTYWFFEMFGRSGSTYTSDKE